MATFVIGKGNYIRPYRNCRIRPFREAASQTFKVGDPLILETTADKGDQVKVAAADPNGTVVGFATGDASGTENTTVNVALLDEQSEFVAVVDNAQALDYDDIGDEIGIIADATNVIWRLDRTETTVPVGRIVAFGPKPDGSGGLCTHGDVNGALVFRSAAAKQGLARP
jgi:hypothetical protein